MSSEGSFKKFFKDVQEGSAKPFQEVYLDSTEKEKAELKLVELKKQEAYAQNTYRIFESALVREDVGKLDEKIDEYGKGEFNFFFSKFVDGVILFKRARMPKAIGKYLRNIVFDYYAKQYKGAPGVDIGTGLDEKIPLDRSYLSTYLSFIAYWLANSLYIEREFGESARDELVKFVTDMAGFYAESGVIFEQAQTRFHRGGRDSKSSEFLHLIDKNKNMFPSLHVEVVAHTYSRILDIIGKYSEDEKNYQFVKHHLLERGGKILDSTLFLKQHSFRDISAGLVAISARDNNFTRERAQNLVDSMFLDDKAKENLSIGVISEIKSRIMMLYDQLMTEIQVDPDKDYTQVLVDYIKSIEQETQQMAAESALQNKK